MATSQLKDLRLSADILTAIDTDTKGLSVDSSNKIFLKVDGSTVGFNDNNELCALGGGGEVPSDMAKMVLSSESGVYTKSNILSQYELSVTDLEYPTQKEIWESLTSIIDILGGKTIQK